MRGGLASTCASACCRPSSCTSRTTRLCSGFRCSCPRPEAPAGLRNAAWTPPEEESPAEAPGLEVGRTEALAAAREVLGASTLGSGRGELVSRINGSRNDATRHFSSVYGHLPRSGAFANFTGGTLEVFGGLGPQHRFVWSEAGEDTHRALLRWRVRYARFEGDVAARAEEHVVWIASHVTPGRREHRLTEGTPGAALSEEAARALARDALVAAPRTLPEVSAESASRPARTDWTFTFRDEAVPDLAGGEARVAVENCRRRGGRHGLLRLPARGVAARRRAAGGDSADRRRRLDHRPRAAPGGGGRSRGGPHVPEGVRLSAGPGRRRALAARLRRRPPPTTGRC